MEEKREFLRLKFSLPLFIKLIEKDEIDNAKKNIGLKSINPLPTNPLNPFFEVVGSDQELNQFNEKFSIMFRMIKELNDKMEYLTSVVEGTKPKIEKKTYMSTYEISGSGFGFFYPTPLTQGQILLAEILISELPKVGVESVAEVTRIEKIVDDNAQHNDNFIHCCRFVFINEKDREKLIYFIFQIQRFLLKGRKLPDTKNNHSS